VLRLTSAIVLVGAVRGSLRSGLLEALWKWQPCTTGELAVRAHLAPRVVGLTLDALAAGGVVTADGQRWTLGASPEAWTALIGFDQHVVNLVEHGEPTCADAADRYTGVLAVLGGFHEPLAAQLAPSLVTPGSRVLELGAGTAPFSRALLAHEATASATAVDLPPVAEQLAARIAATEFAGRIDCHGCDVRTYAATERFDVVVVAGLCRLLSSGDNAELLRRGATWLAPGGRLVVCDTLADSPDRDGALALYALGLAARSRAETLWSGADYDRWLGDAGLERTQLVTTDRPEVTALIYQHRRGGTASDQKDRS
jgi:SAM-dependent methyltransferase